MANTRSRATEIVAPPGADDLKRIQGIGPGIENRLHSAGILTYAQLAAMSLDDILMSVGNLAGLSAELIAKKGWIDRARELAAQKAPTEQYTHKDEPEATESHSGAAIAESRQHYATFKVELLLDENGDVRGTRVAHIQSGLKENWGGWEESRLVRFFVRCAEVQLPKAEPALSIANPEPVLQLNSTAAAVALPMVRGGLTGVLRLRTLETVTLDDDRPLSILHRDRPFHARLSLDLSNVQAPHDVPLNYTATIYAKKMGDRQRQILGEAAGMLRPAEQGIINIEARPLTDGVYRLEATVVLTIPSGEASLYPGVMAMMEGHPIQVY
jgi:hypothetical protein